MKIKLTFCNEREDGVSFLNCRSSLTVFPTTTEGKEAMKSIDKCREVDGKFVCGLSHVVG